MIVMFSAIDRCKSVQKLLGESRFKTLGGDCEEDGTARLKMFCLFHLETGSRRYPLPNGV